MSDFSVTDIIVMENAAIDASLRKLSMRNRPAEIYRETKQSRTVYCTVMEKTPIPLVYNGNVIGGAILKHKYPQRNCSLSRNVEVYKFDSKTEIDEFQSSYNYKCADSSNYYCPECYPEHYSESISSGTSIFMQAIDNGIRLVGILPVKPGYYYFQDKKVYPLQFDNGAILYVRFFHPAGCKCQMKNDRSLYGPYKDAVSALDYLDIGTEKEDRVRNLPCPYCYADSVYQYNKYCNAIHKPVMDALSRYNHPQAVKSSPAAHITTTKPIARTRTVSEAMPITQTRYSEGSEQNTEKTPPAAEKEIQLADEADTIGQSNFDTSKITILTVQASELPSSNGKVSRFLVTAGVLLEEEPEGDPVVFTTLDLRCPSGKNPWYYGEWKGALHFKPEKTADGQIYYGVNMTFDMDEMVENGVYTPNLCIGSSHRHERCRLNELVIKRKKKWSLF
jgi:hypothetical protein